MAWKQSLVTLALGGLAACSVLDVGCSSGVQPPELGSIRAPITEVACNPVDVSPLDCTDYISDPDANGNGFCSVETCWGLPYSWVNGLIPYQITGENDCSTCDPTTTTCFTCNDVSNIENTAAEWTSGTTGVVDFLHCPWGDCASAGYGRWLVIDPGGSSGIAGPTSTGAQHMRLFHNAPEYNRGHELGHAIGLPHEFVRYDRDRYVKLNPTYFCANGKEARQITKCNRFASSDPAAPPVPSDSFGLYDGQSIMNYWQNDPADICNGDGLMPDPNAAAGTGVQPTDGSNAIELVRMTQGWAPSVSLGRDVGASVPLDPSLVAGSSVPIKGGLAVESWGYPDLDVYARGTNDHIYEKWKNIANGVFQSWSDWYDISFHGAVFSSDPAAISWGYGRTDLDARGYDNNIWHQTFISGSGWSGWQNIEAPSGGATSAPTDASWGSGRLDVFVLGEDPNGTTGVYWKVYSGSWSSWTELTMNGIPGGTVLTGKPSAVDSAPGVIDVVVADSNGKLWWLNFRNYQWATSWAEVPNVTVWPGSSPSVSSRVSGTMDIFIRGGDSRIWQIYYSGSWWRNYPQGGITKADPAAIGKGNSSSQRMDVMFVGNDGNVFWKYWPYQQPNTVGSGYPNCEAPI